MDNSTQSKQDNLAKAREVAKANKDAKLAQEVEQKEKKQTKEVTSKHSVLDFEIDPNVTYEFIRLDGNTNARHIPSKTYTWDEDNNKLREIRLSSIEESPYLDEQYEDSRQEQSIIFKGSSIFVSGKEPYKIKYLLAYDGNVDKKVILPENREEKGLYKLRDIGAEQKALIAREELVLEAKMIIKGASDEELDTFLRAQLGRQIELELVRGKAYELANAIPTNFVKSFKDPKNKLKVEYQKLVESGFVLEQNGEIKLASSGATIYNFDVNKVTRVDEEVARFLLTDSKESKTLKTILGL